MAARRFTGMRLPSRHRKTAYGVGLIVFFMLIAAVRPILAPYLGMSRESVTVARVIDGDTIVLADGRHVRYLCINAPEMDAFTAEERRLALEAKDLNSSLVLGKAVRLQFDSERKDKYGRTLAYVWAGDTLVEASIVEAGLAKAQNYGHPNLIWWNKIMALEAKAKAEHKGIWASR
jgi:micrococcal nuclease